MTDLTITPANVRASANARLHPGTAGEAIAPGKPVFRAADGKFYLADANNIALDECDGIAVNGASGANQPILYVSEDPDFTPGATLTPGAVYCVSAAAGGIAPYDDLVAADRTIVLMVARTTSVAALKIVAGGIIPA